MDLDMELFQNLANQGLMPDNVPLVIRESDMPHLRAQLVFNKFYEKETLRMTEEMKKANETVVPNSRQTIAVVFPSSNQVSKKYHYWCERGEVVTGDWVVVKSPRGYACAKVVQVGGFTKYEAQRATKWIVCCVDTEAYDKKVLRERAMQDIKARLRERKEEMEEIAIFKLLAKDDPVTAELLQNLNDIDNADTEELKQLTGPSLLDEDYDTEDLL